MAQTTLVGPGSSPPPRHQNTRSPIPRETFDGIVEPDPENRPRGRQRNGFWARLLNIVGRRGGNSYLYDRIGDGDVQLDGISSSGPDSISRGLRNKRQLGFLRWVIYGGNTALSITLVLIILNLLFGFAFILQMPGPQHPFLYWGKPGTGSEPVSWYPTDFLRDVEPIPCHSHNDYWREIPLFSALYAGCISVEADVWAIDNDLLIGHTTGSLTKERSFRSLYVDPLVEILEKKNSGAFHIPGEYVGVFDANPDQTLTLLIDVKTSGAETWPFVLQQLAPLRNQGWLTYVEDSVVHPRPITVVGTGETPFEALIADSGRRDTFFDAPLDLMWPEHREQRTSSVQSRANESAEPQDRPPASDPRWEQRNASVYTLENSYYASTSFSQTIGKWWLFHLSDSQLDLIHDHITGAHQRQLKARFWELPSWPKSRRNYVWKVLSEAGIDLLNVDDLDDVKGLW